MNKIKCNYKTPNFIYLENILEVIDEFITRYNKVKDRLPVGNVRRLEYLEEVYDKIYSRYVSEKDICCDILKESIKIIRKSKDSEVDKLKELSTDMFEFQDISEYTKEIIFKAEKIMRDTIEYTRGKYENSND